MTKVFNTDISVSEAMHNLATAQISLRDFLETEAEITSTETIFALRINERLAHFEAELGSLSCDLDELKKNL